MIKFFLIFMALAFSPAFAQSPAPGNTFTGPLLSGKAPTASIGGEGAFYLDQTTLNVWGPKSSGAWPSTPATNAITSTVQTIATGPKNRIINGGMQIDQRNSGAAQTITAAAALAYTVDRWYAYSTGANVTGQQVANAGTTSNPSINAYQFTGAANVTSIGFGQRIEQANSFDLAGSTATLSVNLADSLLTTVSWTAYYANTANTFGTLASPTRTQIATGTFTVTSSLTQYSTQIAIPSAATTGIEIVFSVGAQISGTLTIGNVQLEPGVVATSFERRPPGIELSLCQRYYWVLPTSSGVFYLYAVRANGSDTSRNLTISYPVTMRATPTVAVTLSSTVTPSVGPSAQTVNIQATESSSASVDTVTLLTASAEL